ncbi:hypothetical protein CEXT_181861 [Caerostris extrusa]|uniref:Uncharacterized protein n=1 Tax=Caerostris extrusa TaxID=172846 RepID=A0AAV4QQR0_CAEEX|nr:hypothetical protein CEXT_181861 [Caerostris extrusa]
MMDKSGVPLDRVEYYRYPTPCRCPEQSPSPPLLYPSLQTCHGLLGKFGTIHQRLKLSSVRYNGIGIELLDLLECKGVLMSQLNFTRYYKAK